MTFPSIGMYLNTSRNTSGTIRNVYSRQSRAMARRHVCFARGLGPRPKRCGFVDRIGLARVSLADGGSLPGERCDATDWVIRNSTSLWSAAFGAGYGARATASPCACRLSSAAFSACAWVMAVSVRSMQSRMSCPK